MKRSDRITYLLVFLVVYLLITGVLLLILRSLILDDRLEELERLERRAEVLDETMIVRAEQEREIVIELMSMAGAGDYEEAYVMLRSEIENLSDELASVEHAATIERQLRLETVRERDDAVSRAQALRLETARLEANLNACLDSLSSCVDC